MALSSSGQSRGADRQAVIEKLVGSRSELQSMGVQYLAIFGSVARNEAGKESDVDILVELERPAGLLKHARVQNYLTALLNCEVDVVPRTSLRPELRPLVDSEAVRVL